MASPAPPHKTLIRPTNVWQPQTTGSPTAPHGENTRVRAALILLGAAAVVGVMVPAGARISQDRGAPTKVTAPGRVMAAAPTQIVMETTEPEIQPPVPGPSVPTLPPHG